MKFSSLATQRANWLDRFSSTRKISLCTLSSSRKMTEVLARIYSHTEYMSYTLIYNNKINNNLNNIYI